MSRKETLPPPPQPLWFEDPERHDTAMREVVETRIFTADDGQRFSGLYLNRDFTDKPPIVRLDAMFTGSNSPEQKYAAYQYAAAHPDRQVINIDMPAHGYSDGLSDAQFTEIIGPRTLTSIACAQTEALRRRLPNAKEIIVAGDSVGARIAFDMVRQAGQMGLKPMVLAAFDPVGLEHRSTPSVSKSYFWTEWRQSGRLYQNHDQDLPQNAAYEHTFKSELAEYGYRNDFSMAKVFKRDPRIALFVLARSPLATNGGFESLEESLETNPQLAASIVVGGLSSICRWRKIAPVARRLQAQFEGRATFDVWPKDAHGMGLAPQQPRMARYVREALTNLQ